MNNIIFEVTGVEETTDGGIYFFFMEVRAKSEYVSIHQLSYIGPEYLEQAGKDIIAYSYDYMKELYVEFGSKTGNTTPAFSLHFSPENSLGRVAIEVDMEINDNTERKHRCVFYVFSNVAQIEKLGKSMIAMSKGKTKHICLHKEDEYEY